MMTTSHHHLFAKRGASVCEEIEGPRLRVSIGGAPLILPLSYTKRHFLAMAEELNCDLDEGSHQGGSDGGSKSSLEDMQGNF
ncbi:hypothetical protein KIN20_004369 [Parelaphostrongylus tenuis]|uniref:Uncharacterized protein n=1 Tax=Parelaphostrongylus tenuis TaxID=148309 RepID=A0AAD5LYP7_PARTN|nr:hypothetical protein KIN20_004369 [Parelaphostrongylus tenuis]